VLLGCDAHKFKQEGSEFDALFVSDEGRFLGEVEGKDNKAVNVDKLSQLQRNIAEDFSREGVDEMAVGVLFGNAYRLMLPAERPAYFTEKVCKGAAVANIALVRTTDLFRVARFLKDNPNPNFGKLCREAILDGAGKVVVFPDLPVGPTETVRQDDSRAVNDDNAQSSAGLPLQL
jgi:hypothetical protein